MEFFVDKDSVVRKIWGRSDTVLFVFAGAAAEFALNKAVDWLYYTGKLPADPLKRLFSTVLYSRQIFFSEKEAAHKAIDQVTSIHHSVEQSRGAKIPDWAYRDVLFMLIHYSIASFELLERKLTDAEKDEVFRVFYQIGMRMGLKDLPLNYNEWTIMHAEHLQRDLEKSHYTADLYKQYRKHLGFIRYRLLIEAQKLVVPKRVNKLLHLGKFSLFVPILVAYKLSRKIKLDWFLKSLVLPPSYKKQIKEMDVVPA
jgi:hypothetical protein